MSCACPSPAGSERGGHELRLRVPGRRSPCCVTASSLGLVSSGSAHADRIDEDRAARHVVSASWVALDVRSARQSECSPLRGRRTRRGGPGGAYGGDVGSGARDRWSSCSALGWSRRSAVNVAFPLAFVARADPVTSLDRARRSRCRFPCLGSAGGRSSSTGLRSHSRQRPSSSSRSSFASSVRCAGVARGLGPATVTLGVITALAFLAPALVLDDVAGALVGFVLYVAVLAVVKPRGLTGPGSTCGRSADGSRLPKEERQVPAYGANDREPCVRGEDAMTGGSHGSTMGWQVPEGDLAYTLLAQ